MFKRFYKHLISFLSTTIFIAILAQPFSAHGTDVTEVDIIITPHCLDSLLSPKNKNKEYPVRISINNGRYFYCTINTRGSSSFVYGTTTPTKRMPFEIRFDTFTAPPSFFDISSASSLKLNNCVNLYRFVAEYTAMKIYEHMSVPIPASFPTFISFNGIPFGLYLGVEDVSDDFILRYYGKEVVQEGVLYKCIEDNISVPDNVPCFYSPYFGRLVCKSDSDNHDTLISFLSELESQGDYSQYLEIDEILRFFACTAASGGNDSLLSTHNNFYLFACNGKISVIPWDLSSAYDCFFDMQKILPDPDSNTTSPFFDLIMSNDTNQEIYFSYLNDICNTFLDPQISEPFINDFIDSVSEYYIEDRSTMFNKSFALDNIRNGNVLVHGNIMLAVSEIYRQIQEQLSGDADYFYVADGLIGTAYSEISEDELYSDNSFELLDEIRTHFFRSNLKVSLLPDKLHNIIIFAVFVVSFIFILISRFVCTRIKPKPTKKRID